MKLSTKLLSLFAGAATLACFTSTAKAESFSLHLEPGMEVPLTSQQKDIYNIGLSLNTEGLFTLSPNFAIGPAVSATYLPRWVDNGNAGTLWQFGLAARLQGRHDLRADPNDTNDTSSLSPWIEGNFSYARTGELKRPAMGLRVGLDMFTDAS